MVWVVRPPYEMKREWTFDAFILFNPSWVLQKQAYMMISMRLKVVRPPYEMKRENERFVIREWRGGSPKMKGESSFEVWFLLTPLLETYLKLMDDDSLEDLMNLWWRLIWFREEEKKFDSSERKDWKKWRKMSLKPFWIILKGKITIFPFLSLKDKNNWHIKSTVFLSGILHTCCFRCFRSWYEYRLQIHDPFVE